MTVAALPTGRGSAELRRCVVVGGALANPGGRGPVLDLLLVCSGASSLAQLVALEPWSRRHRARWVAIPSAEVLSVLRGERVRWTLRPVADPPGGPSARDLVNLARNLGLAWQVLRQERPDAVLAGDAGTAVPFLALARLLRIPGVYLEDCDRPNDAGSLDRLCRRLADRTVVPWEEQAELYADADVVGCLL